MFDHFRLAFFGLLLSSLIAKATVSITVSADVLKDQDGQKLPLSGIIALVASTSDSEFAGPSEGAFVAGDDVVLALHDLSQVGLSGFVQTFISLSLTDQISAGDPIALYWYPDITEGQTPKAGETYGVYAPKAGEELDGSAEWVVPNDGSTVTLNFFTTDSGPPATNGGSNPASSGIASLTIGASGDGDGNGSGGGDGGSGGGSTFSLDTLLSGADVGGGARFSDWFSFYFPISDTERWVFHNDLGWVYLIGETDSSMWYWDIESSDFWWTANGFYPFTFRSGDSSWYFFLVRADDGSRWFSNQSTGESVVLGNIFE